jgi:N-hydroxyarylamine O-acetyltransferase
MANYYVSTHPASQFRNDLIVARPGDGCRHVMHNNRYAVRYLDGRKDARLLESSAEIIGLLTGIFGIRVPDDASFIAAMDRIVSAKQDG